MDWSLGAVIKGARKDGQQHNNIVGTLKRADGTEYIYKVSRLPSWRPFWEFLVSQTLATKLRPVKHFARVLDVCPLLFEVDSEGTVVSGYQCANDNVVPMSHSSSTRGDLPGSRVIQFLDASPNRKKQLVDANNKRELHGHTRAEPHNNGKQQTVVRLSEVICMIQKLLLGTTLAKQIKCRCSEEYLCGALCQLLAALHCAQTVEFCHRDIHANNVIMVAEKHFGLQKQVFYLYDYPSSDKQQQHPSTGGPSSPSRTTACPNQNSNNNSPVLIPCFGYRAKIIDYEYSHVADVEGKPFDSRLDLIGRGYLPVEFDPTFDVIRMVVSCLTWAAKRGSRLASTILDDLLKQVNWSESQLPANPNACYRLLYVTEDGLTEDEGDPIRIALHDMARTRKDKLLSSLLDSRYYQFVGLLLHRVKLPFRNVLEITSACTTEALKQHCQVLLDFFSMLLQCSSKKKSLTECHNLLFRYVSTEDSSMFEAQSASWKTRFFFLLKLSTDTLQSLYSLLISRQIQKRQGLRNNTLLYPLNMLRWLQQRIPLQKDLQRGDIVYWMRNDSNSRTRVEVPSTISEDTLAEINKDTDVFRRGTLVNAWFRTHAKSDSAEQR